MNDMGNSDDSDSENDLAHLKEYDRNYQFDDVADDDDDDEEEIELTSDEDGSIKYYGSMISLKSSDNIKIKNDYHGDQDDVTTDEDEDDSPTGSGIDNSKIDGLSAEGGRDPIVRGSKEFTSVHELHLEHDSEVALRRDVSRDTVNQSKTEVFTSVHTLNLQHDSPVPEEGSFTPEKEGVNADNPVIESNDCEPAVNPPGVDSTEQEANDEEAKQDEEKHDDTSPNEPNNGSENDSSSSKEGEGENAIETNEGSDGKNDEEERNEGPNDNPQNNTESEA